MVRCGLLIGNSNFPKNTRLGELCAPSNDIEGLYKVLSDPTRGAFEPCECLNNRTSAEVRTAIERCLTDGARGDGFTLIHYSGHGLLDADGRLYLATSDTCSDSFETMVSFEMINDCIRRSRAKRVVIFLDCCYSGAAGYRYRGADATLTNAQEQLHKFSQNQGIYLLTATSRSQLAAEPINGKYGVFTRHIIEGIESGEAANDESDVITITDVYKYVKAQMDRENIGQTPEYWNMHRVGEDLVIAKKRRSLKGSDDAPLGAEDRRVVLQEERGALLDLITPAYLLDGVFHFLDWNACFERIIAGRLNLTRGLHVQEFLIHLRNYPEVEARSLVKFPIGSNPLVDTEILEFESEEFGLVKFRKVACQIPGENGEPRAWSVVLNVCHVDKEGEFWAAMEKTLSEEVNWAKYAKVYDTIIGEFEDYRKLVDLVVRNVGSARVCADLGAGTGNATMKLLEQHPRRTVTCIESNEAMLREMESKLKALEAHGPRRASVRKGDITSCLREEPEGKFDACVMLNVLFALDRPSECLREIFRVLKPGGILSLSTSRKSTNVTRLFRAIEQSLHKRGKLNEYMSDYKDAFARNREMERMITRDSLDDIRTYLTHAGFSIDSWQDNEYVDCVVIAKATKPVPAEGSL